MLHEASILALSQERFNPLMPLPYDRLAPLRAARIMCFADEVEETGNPHGRQSSDHTDIGATMMPIDMGSMGHGYKEHSINSP